MRLMASFTGGVSRTRSSVNKPEVKDKGFHCQKKKRMVETEIKTTMLYSGKLLRFNHKNFAARETI